MKTQTKEMEFQGKLQDIIDEAIKNETNVSAIIGMLSYEQHAIIRQIQDRKEEEAEINTELRGFLEALKV